MFANTLQLMYVVVTTLYCRVDLRDEIKSELNKTQIDVVGAMRDVFAKDIYGKTGF